MIRVTVVKSKTDIQKRVLWSAEGVCLETAIAALASTYGCDTEKLTSSQVIRFFTVTLKYSFHIRRL